MLTSPLTAVSSICDCCPSVPQCSHLNKGMSSVSVSFPRGTSISTRAFFELRPPLKISLFPVHRPGEVMSAEWIHFFHISKIIFFFPAFSTSYTENKIIEKKKKILRPPGGQETNFFLRVA